MSRKSNVSKVQCLESFFAIGPTNIPVLKIVQIGTLSPDEQTLQTMSYKISPVIPPSNPLSSTLHPFEQEAVDNLLESQFIERANQIELERLDLLANDYETYRARYGEISD